MNMKYLAFASAILASVAVSADVLYWQVANTVTVTEPRGDGSSADYTLGTGDGSYAWARVVYGSGDTVNGAVSSAVVAPNMAAGQDYVYMVGADGAAIGSAITGISDYSTQTFWVELYSANGDWIGRSGGVSGQTLSSYVHNPTTFAPTEMAQQAYQFGNFQTVPEPTSGLLMLIGAGLLGLRRRKQA